MTLAKYREIMDHVTVTDEMRSRILLNLSKTDTAGEEKVIRPRAWKKIVPAAACFALIAAAIFMARPMLGGGSSSSESIASMDASEEAAEAAASDENEILFYASAEELSDAVGFNVQEPQNLPFTPVETEYILYEEGLAEIDYISDEYTLVYRKSVGDGDNSGEYDDYENVITESIGTLPEGSSGAADGDSVTLKGYGSTYTLAIWNMDGYAYSINSSEGLTESVLMSMVESVG